MKKILLIDDEKQIRNLYRKVLTKEGFEVLEAKDVEQGIIEMFTKENIGLVLLDIHMPRNDASRVTETIEDYDLPCKVIVSSARSIDDQKYLIPDADDYFDKVQGINILIDKVKKFLGGAA